MVEGLVRQPRWFFIAASRLGGASCGIDLFGTDLNTCLVQIFTELNLSQNVTVWDVVKRIQTALRVPDMVGWSDVALPAFF